MKAKKNCFRNESKKRIALGMNAKKNCFRNECKKELL